MPVGSSGNSEQFTATRHVVINYGQRRPWPGDRAQKIAFGEREPLPRQEILAAGAGSSAALEELVVIADALRALQRSDGGFVSTDVREPLAARGNALIDRLLSDSALACDGVHVENIAGVWTSLRQMSSFGTRPPVYLHWGPLATWRSKSQALLHSFVLAAADHEMDMKIATLDRWALPKAGQYLCWLLDRVGIRLSAPPRFLCSRALLRGGEAAIPPYHFAYFFPEDEGAGGPGHSALIFTNDYQARFEKISLLLAHRFLGAGRVPEGRGAFVPQLLWLRAHDICHNIHLPETDWQAISAAAGPTAVAVLGEVVADIFGYLLLTSPLMRAEFNLSEHDLALGFLAEMLNYLRRDAILFPDSAAACLELNYLVQHGWVRVNEDLSLDWAAHKLQAGFEALALELLGEVLAGDADAARAFLGRYGAGSAHPPTNATVSPLLHALGYQLPHIPTIATA